jgi:hypothetical protein
LAIGTAEVEGGIVNIVLATLREHALLEPQSTVTADEAQPIVRPALIPTGQRIVGACVRSRSVGDVATGALVTEVAVWGGGRRIFRRIFRCLLLVAPARLVGVPLVVKGLRLDVSRWVQGSLAVVWSLVTSIATGIATSVARLIAIVIAAIICGRRDILGGRLSVVLCGLWVLLCLLYSMTTIALILLAGTCRILRVLGLRI